MSLSQGSGTTSRQISLGPRGLRRELRVSQRAVHDARELPRMPRTPGEDRQSRGNERATREKARLAAREWEGWLYTDSVTGKARPTAEVIDRPLYLLDPDTGQYLASGHDPEKGSTRRDV